MNKSLLVLLLVLVSSSAYSCSCRKDLSAGERIRASDYIFLGQVVEIRTVDPNPVHAGFTEFEITIDVLETWKGAAQTEIKAYMNAVYNDPLENSSMRTSCSAPIPVNFRGMVVLLTDDTMPTLTSCVHNAWPIDESEIDTVFEVIREELNQDE